MGKILYFRSSTDPLILDEEQREVRRKGSLSLSVELKIDISCDDVDDLARVDSLKKNHGFTGRGSRTALPDLTSSLNRMGIHHTTRNELSKLIGWSSRATKTLLCL